MRTETKEAIEVLGQEDFTEVVPGIYRLEGGRVFIANSDGLTGLLIWQ